MCLIGIFSYTNIVTKEKKENTWTDLQKKKKKNVDESIQLSKTEICFESSSKDSLQSEKTTSGMFWCDVM